MERLTKPDGEFVICNCSHRPIDCETVHKYNKVYMRLKEYEDLDVTPFEVICLKEQLKKYEAIGTPEEITYMLDHPEFETRVESFDIEIDDTDFKDALIKAFKAGMDVMRIGDGK